MTPEIRKALESAREEIAAALRQIDINVSIARRDNPEGPMVDGRRLDNPHFPHTQEILAGHVKDHLARVSSALDTALADGKGWRTMDSAPKDGTNILYRNQFREIGFCHWDEGYEDEDHPCWWDNESDDEVVPIVWLPSDVLPAFPTPPASEERP